MQKQAQKLSILFAIFAVTGAAAAAQAPSVPLNQVDASYSLTKTGWGSADRITNPGTVYVVRIDGMLARAIADHVTPTNVITDGKLVPPAKGFLASFGASGDSQQIKPGDRFYLHDIDEKDNSLVFTLISLEKRNVVVHGNSTMSRLRMYIKFPMSSASLNALTPASAHALTDPVFAPEGSPILTPTVQLGESLAQVREIMGDPLQQVNLGNKEILVYQHLKITLTDGKVTDAE